ncbi:cysteine desulfurase family protein [Lederbergia citrea]|uniref:Cysteine desulfurase n=1 Tax=Lederbergia citrea TaxID=2833581 RepID=A0A942UTR0_9BACI|nr:cysteine desulfurase family protein [Lederbergia citrea]MBS4202575.1 cysteine desulfurase [Lederbergia citrea]MBS4222759.1 cysteine desulfurase [Lederbergia citrea]
MIYLDNSATTRPNDEVLDAYIKVNENFFANASSLHNFGGKVEQLITKAREQIADLAGVKPSEIIFTSGGTEGNNLAIKGAAINYQARGNHIITTAVEHPSVKEPCKQLEGMGFKITYLPVNAEGAVSASAVEAAITDETILVSIIHVNNEIGTVQPVKEIGRLLQKYPKVIYHVDHVQGAGKVALDLYESHIDLCTFSAHKFNGLKGSGFLFKKQSVKLAPLLTGGNQEQKLRSGTENTGGIVAMAKAYRLAESNRIHKGHKLLQIREFLLENLQSIPGVIIHTPVNGAPHIICLSCKGQKGEVMVHALEEEGIIVSTTSACSSKEQLPSSTLKAIGVENDIAQGAIRVSLSTENTLEEAEIFIKKLTEILQRLNKVMRRNQ